MYAKKLLVLAALGVAGTANGGDPGVFLLAGGTGGLVGRPWRIPSEPKGREVRRQAGANAPAAIGLAPSCAATVLAPTRTRLCSGALTCKKASPVIATK